MTNFTFKPVSVGRASEDIALQIESAILSQSLKPGDKLPSERELQEQFGTGRGVIRETIQALKQKGLIEIHKGAKGGAVVREVDVGNVSESLSLLLKQQHVSPQSIIEFRETIDQTIALLAMARATDDEKQSLLEQCKVLGELNCVEEFNFMAIGEQDRRLNLHLAKMTHNPIFDWVMNALQQGFSSHDYHLYKNEKFRTETVENWHQTVQSLIDGNPLELKNSISHHYWLLKQCVNQ